MAPTNEKMLRPNSEADHSFQAGKDAALAEVRGILLDQFEHAYDSYREASKHNNVLSSLHNQGRMSNCMFIARKLFPGLDLHHEITKDDD